MRAKVSLQKGNGFIVMPYGVYESIMESSSKPQIKGVTKLSFLHHGGHIDKVTMQFPDYSMKVGDYASQMPDLKEIVLRGCGTANPPDEKKVEAKSFADQGHALKIIADKRDIQKLTPQGEVVLLQQKPKETGAVETLVKYRDKDKSMALKQLETIHLIKSENDLTIGELGAIATACEDIPLKAYHNKKRELLLNKFFNSEAPMSKSERKDAKELVLRARTEAVKDFGSDPTSLATRVRESLIKKGCHGITVKAYIGGYKAAPDRAIPFLGHGYDKKPKALSAKVSEDSPEPKAIKIDAHKK